MPIANKRFSFRHLLATDESNKQDTLFGHVPRITSNILQSITAASSPRDNWLACLISTKGTWAPFCLQRGRVPACFGIHWFVVQFFHANPSPHWVKRIWIATRFTLASIHHISDPPRPCYNRAPPTSLTTSPTLVATLGTASKFIVWRDDYLHRKWISSTGDEENFKRLLHCWRKCHWIKSFFPL